MDESKLELVNERVNYPSEGKLLYLEMLEKLGVTKDEYRELSSVEKGKVMKQLRQIFREPEVAEILKSKDAKGLSAKTAKKIREVVGIEKWNSLSETVSYVKTLIGENDDLDRGKLYSEHLAFGVDKNEIKHTLTRINDVVPARIETDIKHQSTLFYRAVVEVASNALDASIKHRSPIGRFGIGFYQILNHLQDSKDRVIVKTKSEDESVGIRVEFKNKDGNIDFSIKEDSSIEEHGTVVELRSKGFEEEEARKIIEEYFSHTQDAELKINDEKLERWQPDGGAEPPKDLPLIDVKLEDGKCVISDNGIGMSPRVVFEKLLVPKLSEKPPVYKLKEKGKISPRVYYEKGDSEQEHKSEIVLQVGGIVIEKISVRGIALLNTLVIDLPPSTVLGEQRDKIEVNEETVGSFKDVIDQAMNLSKPECFEVINSLLPACREFQNRSKLYQKDDNIIDYLQKRVKESFSDMHFLPNEIEFHELALGLKEVALLDPNIYQSPIDLVPGLKRVSSWISSSNTPLFEAKFKNESKLGVIATDNFLIIDERAQVEKNPEIMNKVVELSVGWNKGKMVTLEVETQKQIDKDLTINSEVETQEHAEEALIVNSEAETQQQVEKEPRSFDSLIDLVSEQWENFSFESQWVAKYQAKMYEIKNSEITQIFTQKILSRLSGSSAVEAWDILHRYIHGDDRSNKIKIKEINQLSKNIDVLFASPQLVEILKINGVSIFSMFEQYEPDTPAHFKIKKDGNYSIDGVNYVKKEEGMRSERFDRYYSEEGYVVDIGGPGKILFRDSEITVYRDKIQDSQTGEIINPELPINNSWVTIDKREKTGDDGEEKSEFVYCTKYLSKHRVRNNEDEETQKKEKIWSHATELVNEEHRSMIEIEGQKSIDLDVLKANAGIEFGGYLSDVLINEGGDPLLIFHDSSESNMLHSYDDKISPEFFCIINKEGKVLWQFDPSKWSSKVTVYGEFESARREEKLVEETEKRMAQCIPIAYDRPVSDDEPIVKIVNYYFIGNGRFREIVAYVNAKGEEKVVNETDEVNQIIMDAKYSTESSCTCCGVDAHFSKSYYKPMESDQTKSPIEAYERLSVEVVSDFKHDELTDQWIAMAQPKGARYDHKEFYMVVFDKDGNHLETAKIGSEQESVHGGMDYRNMVKSLQHRLPERLRDFGARRDDRSWDYSHEIKKFITTGEQVLFNKRTRASYSDEFEPKLQESDNQSRGLLDTKKGVLKVEHAVLLKNYLLKYPIPNREKFERVTYRVLENRHLSPADMELLLPIFYEAEYIEPNFFIPEIVDLFRKVGYLDSRRLTTLFKIVRNSIDINKEDDLLVANKIIKFYCEKFQSESINEFEDLVYELSYVREYSNAVNCDGYTLIKNKISVPQSELPRTLRPFLTFIQREEDELASKGVETVKVPETKAQTINLSEIIQWKRLRESSAQNFEGTIDDLGDTVRLVTEGKKREHIVREITHAVHFQALNSTDLYVWELIQNAVDVMQADGMDEEKRNIEITVAANVENELTTSFQDPVGMDISTVLNQFLVPGETSKLDKSKGFIGYYGQGVYTLFKDFKEIKIKTSTGDGTVWYLTIKPIVEHEMINDVSIDFRSASEEFKGTIISKNQEVDNPYIEAAFVKDAVMTLTSALSSDRANISYQDESINAKYETLSINQIEDLGDLIIYKNPNNIVTQYGLYVKDLGSEYTGLIPDFMNKSLQNWGGIVIDLPTGVELTRSRQDIANKDKIQKVLNRQVQLALVKSYFESFRNRMEDGSARFPIDELPYDYLSRGEDYHLPAGYIEDAEALFKGEPLKHLDEYDNKSNAIKLMTLLPLFEVNDHKVSLEDIRKAVLSKEVKFPFDQENWMNSLPYKLVKFIENQREKRRSTEEKQKEDKKFCITDCGLKDAYSQATEELKEWMDGNMQELELVDKITTEFVDVLNDVYDKHSTGLFYYSNRSEIAHARRGGSLSWNLQCMNYNHKSPVDEVRDFLDEEKGGKIDDLMNTLSTLIHEYGHIIEGMWSWTHDTQHEKEQASLFVQFMMNDGPNRILRIFEDFVKEKKKVESV
jgi:hypothetical protein